MAEDKFMTCEVSRSAGYDPTGEFAVECGTEGEYCSVCEMVVCEYCHKHIASDRHHLNAKKKIPAGVGVDSNRRKTA
jgi:hypothetical protein